MNGYDLSRQWFDFAFEKTECKVQHTAIYMWIIELNNRLGWKSQFGLPTGATMEGLSIGDKRTYLNAIKDLQEWGFIKVVKEAKNQFQSCIIEICHSEITPAKTTALDTALSRQNTDTTHDTTHGGTPIVKPLNNETFKLLNNKTNGGSALIEIEEVFEQAVLKETKTPSKVPRKVSPPGFEFNIPLPFDTVEFAEAWADWAKFRIEVRKKLTASTTKAQLTQLSKQPSEETAIAMIRRSIEKGWQGLFELKNDRPSFNPSYGSEKGKIQLGLENSALAAENIRRRRRQLENQI